MSIKQISFCLKQSDEKYLFHSEVKRKPNFINDLKAGLLGLGYLG